MWFDDATIYQIYPLGLCGAPLQNDGSDQTGEHRILRVLDWVEHIKKLGATCVLFNPLFDSDAHGYDTRDYNRVDPRLGTKEDFQAVCKALHEAGIRVMLDGVFNHVGRGFWAFRDVQEKKWDSAYKDWFHISFDGNTGYNDGFWYEAWEGCYELVKLNLRNPAVKEHLFDAVRGWVRDYDIDGLRLDVAYCLDLDFLAELRGLANSIKPEFALMGETLHGDYNRWMNDRACHAVTNYECYKGLYSSFNSANMHEIAYSLNRQFGSEQWCLYTGRHLLSFLDNHDVSRIATVLTDKAMLRPAYGLLFGMPGVPAVYYGSEWGLEGDKKNGDATLRPAIEKPQENELTEWISALAKARAESPALRWGSYHNVMVQPRQLIFGGRLTEELGKQFTPHGLSIYDYFSREELAVQNAVPTAEGAIQLAMEELPITVRDARCLVTGYGRVAKALTRALTALGAHVTVAARRCSDRAAAQCEGCAAVTPDEIPLGDGYDVYFNTVPALLFPAEVLERLPKGALLIDLASRPGGVDFTAAAACGVRTVWAQSLPGRVAPKTAAAIIRRTVFNLIRELRGQEESL